jgi:hypothetical protein
MQEKIPVFLKFILFITRLLGYYWGHYNFVTGHIGTKYSCIFMEKNNTIKYSKPLPLTFNVRKQFIFIGEYFGWCKYVVTGGRPRFSQCSTPSH